jgi:biopolymer transport protein ExbD
VRLKGYEPRKGRIEIIPMIDVVFFLLVFSMLSALQMAELNLLSPEVPKAGGARGEANRITVNLIRGQVFLTFETPDRREQVRTSEAGIEALVRAERERNPRVIVLLNVSDAVPFDVGARLLDRVERSGAPVIVPG